MKDLAPISAQLMTVPGGVLLDRPGPGTNDDPVIYAKIASIVRCTAADERSTTGTTSSTFSRTS